MQIDFKCKRFDREVAEKRKIIKKSGNVVEMSLCVRFFEIVCGREQTLPAVYPHFCHLFGMLTYFISTRHSRRLSCDLGRFTKSGILLFAF